MAIAARAFDFDFDSVCEEVDKLATLRSSYAVSVHSRHYATATPVV